MPRPRRPASMVDSAFAAWSRGRSIPRFRTENCSASSPTGGTKRRSKHWSADTGEPMVLAHQSADPAGHAHDAEDVFQAAFVILAQKAASQRWQRSSVASWLYQDRSPPGTPRARQSATRRTHREQASHPPVPRRTHWSR